MSCQRYREHVVDYLYGDLSPQEHERFESHLKGCPDCRSYYHEMGATVERIRMAPTPEPSEDSLQKITLMARQDALVKLPIKILPRWIFRPAFGLMLIAILVAGTFAYQGGFQNPTLRDDKLKMKSPASQSFYSQPIAKAKTVEELAFKQAQPKSEAPAPAPTDSYLFDNYGVSKSQPSAPIPPARLGLETAGDKVVAVPKSAGGSIRGISPKKSKGSLRVKEMKSLYEEGSLGRAAGASSIAGKTLGESDSWDMSSLYSKAIGFQATRENEQAVLLFAQVIEASPSFQLPEDHSNPYVRRGDCLMTLGRYSEAVESYKEAKRRYPSQAAVIDALLKLAQEAKNKQQKAKTTPGDTK